MARVGGFISRGQAELAAGYLEVHGISARVSADDAGGVAPHFALGAHGVALEVREQDAALARELLDTELAGDIGALTDGSGLRFTRVRAVGAVGAAAVLGLYVFNLLG